MKRLSLVLVLAVAMLACAALAFAKGEATKKMAAHATALSAGDLTWEPMPNLPAVKVAKIRGDMSKGAYSAFVKLPANEMHPLHTHTNSVTLVVISGEFKYAPEGGEEKVLGPGSYLMVPGGLRHTSGTGDAECVIYQEQSGSWDLKPVMAKK